MTRAVFPGSFDPMTVGHLDLIKRASKMFDEVVVGILINSSKNALISMEDRVRLVELVLSKNEIKNVSVKQFDGLLVDFLKQEDASVIVRGLRSAADFEYEIALAQGNRKLNQNADTVFLATSPEYSYVSSSAVKELLRYDADVSDYVPCEVLDFLNFLKK